MTTWYFVRPADTLFVRGNLAFGEAGEHGTGLMPPAPFGALRSVRQATVRSLGTSSLSSLS